MDVITRGLCDVCFRWSRMPRNVNARVTISTDWEELREGNVPSTTIREIIFVCVLVCVLVCLFVLRIQLYAQSSTTLQRRIKDKRGKNAAYIVKKLSTGITNAQGKSSLLQVSDLFLKVLKSNFLSLKSFSKHVSFIKFQFTV